MREKSTKYDLYENIRQKFFTLLLLFFFLILRIFAISTNVGPDSFKRATKWNRVFPFFTRRNISYNTKTFSCWNLNNFSWSSCKYIQRYLTNPSQSRSIVSCNIVYRVQSRIFLLFSFFSPFRSTSAFCIFSFLSGFVFRYHHHHPHHYHHQYRVREYYFLSSQKT